MDAVSLVPKVQAKPVCNMGKMVTPERDTQDWNGTAAGWWRQTLRGWNVNRRNSNDELATWRQRRPRPLEYQMAPPARRHKLVDWDVGIRAKQPRPFGACDA